jgi:hypothetical protein
MSDKIKLFFLFIETNNITLVFFNLFEFMATIAEK